MREIKFRCWDEKNRRWVKNIDEDVDGRQAAFIGAPPSQKLVTPSGWILMQYTGLKDKNGVEIYEGDILKHSLWKIPVVVYWEYGGFMAKSAAGELGKRSYTDGTLYDMQLPKCKVIGNIYTPPPTLIKQIRRMSK